MRGVSIHGFEVDVEGAIDPILSLDWSALVLVSVCKLSLRRRCYKTSQSHISSHLPSIESCNRKGAS